MSIYSINIFTVPHPFNALNFHAPEPPALLPLPFPDPGLVVRLPLVGGCSTAGGVVSISLEGALGGRGGLREIGLVRGHLEVDGPWRGR